MDEILEFIKRRFPVDCNWLTGNCYYFSLILKDRFPSGEIFYDVVGGHFVFKYNGIFYDWTGIVEPNVPISWERFDGYDQTQKLSVIKGCIL